MTYLIFKFNDWVFFHFLYAQICSWFFLVRNIFPCYLKHKSNPQWNFTNVETEWGNLIRGKESQKEANKLRIHLPPLLGVSKNIHQANSHDIYAECLVQIHAGPVLASSLSMNPCELFLVDSAGNALLVTTICSELTQSFLSLFSGDPQSPKGRTQWTHPI